MAPPHMDTAVITVPPLMDIVVITVVATAIPHMDTAVITEAMGHIMGHTMDLA